MAKKITYQQAGVDIDANDQMVDLIREMRTISANSKATLKGNMPANTKR